MSKAEVVKFVDISGKLNPNRIQRIIFTTDEIESLKSHSESLIEPITLILIYSGLRIGELLALKKEDVHPDYFDIIESKTQSGVRQVPIADKIRPLVEKFMKRDGDYFISNNGKKYSYPNFYTMWKEAIPNHSPHDTRHTCITLLTEAEIDDRTIKQIVGHKGNSVTEQVYTHVTLAKKLEAINKI